MTTGRLRIVSALGPVALLLALSATAAHAHHAFVAVFDLSKQRDFKGKITDVEWLNPHAHFVLDVVEPNGKTARWEFELGSPNALMQHGWTRYTLKKGDVVTVTGDIARDGRNFAHARLVTWPGGTRMCDYDRFNDPAWSCSPK
jgi:Family of unknown function (DUF6152)